MKILIKNFGPIHEFEFDSDKDLHLIYGKNSIGKSHAIAAVYLILKNLISSIEPTSLIDFTSKSGKSEENNNYFRNFLEQKFVPKLFQSFQNSFSKFKNNKNTELFVITISGKGWSAILDDIGADSPNISLKTVDDFYFGMIESELSKIENLYFLPSSRSGLYQGMLSTAPLLAQFSQIRFSIPNAVFTIPTFSEPVSDFFLQLTSANSNGKSNVFARIAEQIEREIIKGQITVNKDSKKIEFYDTSSDIWLEVQQASSMIAELAPLVVFLKYILKKSKPKKDDNDRANYLFIEEPEAHLHPLVQVALMEIFAEMANNGIKVIMTTHSDFMFNELTNLILGDKIKPEQVASVHLVMTEKGSIDKGDMKATAEGIDDFNFSEVTEQLYEERMRLIDLKNEVADVVSEN